MSAKIEWPRAKTLHFIELIKPHVILWDVKNEDFKNKTLRDGKYVDIISKTRFRH